MDIANYLAAVGVLALVIFVHELGHFLVAKWCDVEVLTFSIGFGPTLLSKTVGETEYRLALIPLGGYVRMAGQDDSEDLKAEDPTRGFSAQSIRERTAIVAAGPAVNFVFAFFIFAVAALAFGQMTPSEAPRVRELVDGAPAAAAGIKIGDTVVSIDGNAIENWDQLSAAISGSEGRTLSVTVRRADNSENTLSLTPESREDRDHIGEIVGTRFVIGIGRDFDNQPVGFAAAVAIGAQQTWRWTSAIFETLLRLFQGRLSASDLGGPIMIGQEAARRADTGLQPLMLFVALISVNLGVINILPIPVLDGGHLMFFGIEALRGKPISIRYREMAQQVGVFLILALMVFVVFNDINRIVTG